jgi:hypothetical protein
VKTGQIFGISGHELNPGFKSLRIGLANPDLRIYEVGIVNHKTKQIFLELGFVITIQNKSMDSQNKSMFLQISYRITASLLFCNFETEKVLIKSRVLNKSQFVSTILTKILT